MAEAVSPGARRDSTKFSVGRDTVGSKEDRRVLRLIVSSQPESGTRRTGVAVRPVRFRRPFVNGFIFLTARGALRFIT